MSAGRSSRNNIIAGLFVVFAATLFVIVVVVMSNISDFLTPRTEYTVRFSVMDGVDGLDTGAQVKVGGQRVGKVKKIIPHSQSGKPDAIDVIIEIPTSIKLSSDLEVQMIKPLLGTGSTLNIAPPYADAGAPAPQGTPIAPGSVIPGHPGPPGFLAPGDYAKLSSLLKQGDEFVRENRPKLNEIVTDAQASVKNFRSISDDVGKKWPTWSQQVSDVIARVEKASQNFDSIVTKVDQVATSLQSGVTKAEAFIDDAKKLIDDNSERINGIVKDIKSVTEKADTVWSERITSIMDEAMKALKTADETIQQGRDILTRNSSQIDDTVANISIASQQLKLAMVEIRAAPWRLTYQPGKKELENELLYNSVRQYSEAVGELKSAAESLKSVTQQSSQGAKVDQAQVDAMTARLKRAFDEYQKTERAFLDRWAGETKAK
jgi:ABC-type transporter Mla subunit MlaD